MRELVRIASSREGLTKLRRVIAFCSLYFCTYMGSCAWVYGGELKSSESCSILYIGIDKYYYRAGKGEGTVL